MNQNKFRGRHGSGGIARSLKAAWLFTVVVLALAGGGCKSPDAYRLEADKAAAEIIRTQQERAFGQTQPFTIETPARTLRRRLLAAQGLPVSCDASLGTDRLKPIAHWPQKPHNQRSENPTASTQPALAPQGDKPIRITLSQALQIAARNNRQYQSSKENIFRAALSLDLESREFRNTYSSLLTGVFTQDESGGNSVSGLTGSSDVSWSRRFKSGASLTGRLGVDLVKLLTRDYSSSLGLLADASISVPLLRGAGRHIVLEPLTQAQRNVIYSMYAFERYKRILAVRVAREYLAVLQQLDQADNALENHRRLIVSARRAEKLAKAGRLRPIQADQARQDELRARDRWVRAGDSYHRRQDELKIILGLPTDALIELDYSPLQRLVAGSKQLAQTTATTMPAATGADSQTGKMELPEKLAIEIALSNRLDLRTVQGRVFDAQRAVVVAADALKADLTLQGSAAMGSSRSLSSADSPNARLRPEKGVYGLSVTSDLPWERTAERNSYRNAFISLERASRNVQELEDQTKLDIRNELRTLKQARTSLRIQSQAVKLAQRRVTSTKLFLEAGRAEIRDELEAQEALISAQNSLTSAIVDYRVAELELQRDMGVLTINEKGLWREYQPKSEK